MATLTEIANADRYAGNPISGGGFYQGVTIDTSPLQRLATFTYYRDRDLWQKKQIDDRAAAKEIADLTAYDISSPMKGYTDYLLNKKNEALDFLKKNPNALSIDKDKEGYIKFRQIVGDFERARKAANTSEVIYNARKTAADKAGTDLEKQLALDYLNESVNDLFANGIEGALNNTLESARPLNQKDYEVPKIATSTIEYIGQDPNDNKKYTIKSFDLNKLKGDSFLAWSGANKSTLDENSPEFKRLSPKRQELARRENELVSKKMSAAANISNSLNGLLQQQKQLDQNFKPSEITGDFTGDTLLDAVKLFNKTNAQIRDLNALIRAGSLEDKTGVKVTKLFPEINIDDGITPDEYIMVEAIAANGGSLFSLTKDVQLTDNALQRSRLGLDWAKFNYATDEDKFGASSVINEAKDIIDKGVETGVNYGGKVETVLRIGDPNLLKSFGTIDKDGKTTNVPDVIDYDRRTDQIKLIYYRPTKTKSGKNFIEKEVSLDQRTWLKEIAKRSFPNKDLGSINTLVDDILSKNGNSLYKLTQSGKTETESSNSKTPEGTMDEWLSTKGWTKERVLEYQKKGLIKVKQ